MASGRRNKEILKRHKEPLLDAVAKELSPKHAEILEFMFDELKLGVSRMQRVIIPRVGAIGIHRKFAASLCVRGDVKEEHMKLCENVVKNG
jgi:hypothetical protein